MRLYLTLPNYLNNLRQVGFTDEDLAGGGSERLVDAVVAWGDADAIEARVREHRDAGAGHVLLHRSPPICRGRCVSWRNWRRVVLPGR
jgi:hypothetical protein